MLRRVFGREADFHVEIFADGLPNNLLFESRDKLATAEYQLSIGCASARKKLSVHRAGIIDDRHMAFGRDLDRDALEAGFRACYEAPADESAV